MALTNEREAAVITRRGNPTNRASGAIVTNSLRAYTSSIYGSCT